MHNPQHKKVCPRCEQVFMQTATDQEKCIPCNLAVFVEGVQQSKRDIAGWDYWDYCGLAGARTKLKNNLPEPCPPDLGG
jgi:hypothetical protein